MEAGGNPGGSESGRVKLGNYYEMEAIWSEFSTNRYHPLQNVQQYEPYQLQLGLVIAECAMEKSVAGVFLLFGHWDGTFYCTKCNGRVQTSQESSKDIVQ